MAIALILEAAVAQEQTAASCGPVVLDEQRRREGWTVEATVPRPVILATDSNGWLKPQPVQWK